MNSQKEIDFSRYHELKKTLENASRLYYKDGFSPISDQDFDFGLKELEQLEKNTLNLQENQILRKQLVAIL